MTNLEREQVKCRLNLPGLPSVSPLILDGIRLEQPGAFIFTGYRALASAIQRLYNDCRLWATAITHTPETRATELTVWTHSEYTDYALGDTLFDYQSNQKKRYYLVESVASQRYMTASQFQPERDCPPGFAWWINE